MKTLWLSCLFLTLGCRPFWADTIYETNADGNEIVLQSNALVIGQDSSFVVYKHFDLKEHRVTVVRLNRGSLPFRVQTSNASGRAQIVKVWKQFGFNASITDQTGKITQVSDVYLDFYPPGGRGSLLESIPGRTNFPLLTDDGPNEIEFEKIDHVEMRGEQLRVVLRDQKAVTGKFLSPTAQPVEVRVLGITDSYDPSSQEAFDYAIPLSQLKLISFKPNALSSTSFSPPAKALPKGLVRKTDNS